VRIAAGSCANPFSGLLKFCLDPGAANNYTNYKLAEKNLFELAAARVALHALFIR